MDLVKNVVFSVKNLDISIPWYEKNLGFKLKSERYIEKLKCRVCHLEREGFVIQLFQVDGALPLNKEERSPGKIAKKVGIKHIAFNTDNITEVKNKMFANDVEIVMDITGEGEKILFICDPDGILFEFVEEQKK